MNRILGYIGVMLVCVMLAGCGGSSSTITAKINPANSTADHAAATPGNQVQYSLVTGGKCQIYIADFIGTWSTSDPVNTTISNQDPTRGLATCVHPTVAPATISYDGGFCGHRFPSATLSCR